MACEQTVDVGACEASGTNAVSNASNYIVQYPKPYRRTDGRWIALGSLIGTVIGAMSNKGVVGKAKDAESNWNGLTDDFNDKGRYLFNTYAPKLEACADELKDRLCALAKCNYSLDILGAIAQARTIAELEASRAMDKLCRTSSRMHTGRFCKASQVIETARIGAQVAATMQTLTSLRKAQYEIAVNTTMQLSTHIEAAMLARYDLGARYMQIASYSYRALAQSYRNTAKSDQSDTATLFSLLGVILPMLVSSMSDPEDSCADSTTPTPTPAPAP